MNTYYFAWVPTDRPDDHRDMERRILPDDTAAVAWMGRELIGERQELRAFRDGETVPFAQRRFAEDAEVLV